MKIGRTANGAFRPKTELSAEFSCEEEDDDDDAKLGRGEELMLFPPLLPSAWMRLSFWRLFRIVFLYLVVDSSGCAEDH